MIYLKKFLLAFLPLIPLMTLAQEDIEIERGKFPFNKIVEWPRKGTLMIGTDPSGRSQEINLNLLNFNGEIQWNRSVFPKQKNSHLIISSLSDYIYFVDDLKLNNNSVRYNQVNQSGSVVPTKFDMLSVIRSYRYTTPDDLVLKEIVNTPKALVFYYQLPIKDKGIIENFFVTITHHNNRVYHCKGPVSDYNLTHKGEENIFVFAGANDDEISFSKYGLEGHKKSATLFSFNSKAEPISTNTIIPSQFSPLPSEVEFIGLNGSYYLKEQNRTQIESNGTAIVFNENIYYVVNDEKERCLKVYGQNEKGEFVVLNECGNQADNSRRYNSSLVFVPLDNKLFVLSSINEKTNAVEFSEQGVKNVAIATLDLEKIRENPRSFKTKSNKNEYVHLINDIPYTIDLSNLEKLDKFVFKKQ